jgi:hypothetical protein
MLPDPVVDPSTAAKISEAWLDNHEMSWGACVARLYGRDARELTESPNDKSSTFQPLTPSKRVDSSQMKTEFGRRIAEQANRRLSQVASFLAFSQVSTRAQRSRCAQSLGAVWGYSADWASAAAKAFVQLRKTRRMAMA